MRKHSYWLVIAICANSLIANLTAWGEDRQVLPASAAKIKLAPEVVEIRDFEVRVDNKPMGSHRLTIKSSGEIQKVESQTDVKVNVIVYTYVFKFRGTEIWRDGRVQEAEIYCEDGGKKRSFTLKSEGETQHVTFNGQPIPGAARVAMTTAYWKLPAAEFRTKLFPIADVDTGAIRNATLSLAGPDAVTAGGRSVACQHYKIDGPSPADLWFDEQNCLVCQKSLESGHAMELRLKQIQLSK